MPTVEVFTGSDSRLSYGLARASVRYENQLTQDGPVDSKLAWLTYARKSPSSLPVLLGSWEKKNTFLSLHVDRFRF